MPGLSIEDVLYLTSAVRTALDPAFAERNNQLPPPPANAQEITEKLDSEARNAVTQGSDGIDLKAYVRGLDDNARQWLAAVADAYASVDRNLVATLNRLALQQVRGESAMRPARLFWERLKPPPEAVGMIVDAYDSANDTVVPGTHRLAVHLLDGSQSLDQGGLTQVGAADLVELVDAGAISVRESETPFISTMFENNYILGLNTEWRDRYLELYHAALTERGIATFQPEGRLMREMVEAQRTARLAVMAERTARGLPFLDRPIIMPGSSVTISPIRNIGAPEIASSTEPDPTTGGGLPGGGAMETSARVFVDGAHESPEDPSEAVDELFENPEAFADAVIRLVEERPDDATLTDVREWIDVNGGRNGAAKEMLTAHIRDNGRFLMGQLAAEVSRSERGESFNTAEGLADLALRSVAKSAVESAMSTEAPARGKDVFERDRDDVKEKGPLHEDVELRIMEGLGSRMDVKPR